MAMNGAMAFVAAICSHAAAFTADDCLAFSCVATGREKVPALHERHGQTASSIAEASPSCDAFLSAHGKIVASLTC